MSVCFDGKPCVKIVFHVFQWLLVKEKWVKKKIFGQYKKYASFLEIIFHYFVLVENNFNLMAS